MGRVRVEQWLRSGCVVSTANGQSHSRVSDAALADHERVDHGVRGGGNVPPDISDRCERDLAQNILGVIKMFLIVKVQYASYSKVGGKK